MIRNRKLLKTIALYLVVQLSLQIVFPTVGYALTSGPGQPEFSSFEPVATTNMVDEFSGDFTYNLPVLEVPGPQGSSYPISLSYHSGVSPEEEASWVGYGWTLNPGAINRTTRGLPDDFNGQSVTFHNKAPKNWTATVGAGASFGEITSVDLAFGFNASLRYNNYRGFGYNRGIGLSLGRGVVNLGYNVSDGQSSFSANVSPAAILNNTARRDQQENKSITDLQKGEIARSLMSSVASTISQYGIYSFNQFEKPAVVQRFVGGSFNISAGGQTNVPPFPVGVTVNVFGSFSFQKNIDSEDLNAYGYMYSAKAKSEDVMDYHIEKDTPFNRRDVFLGVPFNDADNFTVTGEGLGGGFRLHNKTAGHFGPRKVTSLTSINNISVEVDLGWTNGVGADLGAGVQVLEIDDWKRNISSFSDPSDQNVDEPVFFRFNNDMGGEWGANISDKPEKASISGFLGGILKRDPSVNSQLFSYNGDEGRGGRSSYIGYHTYKEVFTDGVSFNKNLTVKNQARHDDSYKDLVGEIAVVNQSGNRYLYALPVYNKNEKNLNFSGRGLAAASIVNNYMAYPTNGDDPTGGELKVGQEQDSPYASTFLLTEINTPDFIDMTRNGATLDDLGGYTRFNYKTVTTSGDWYKWRSPYNGMLYSRNSQSDPKDDQVSYNQGEKEIYYLESIETKTHVAIFTTGLRDDSQEASDNPLASDATPGPTKLHKLLRIDLYPRSAFIEDSPGVLRRDPTTGTPVLIDPNKNAIKTVHFKYNNDLAKDTPNALSGKLTLEQVYFEYNEVKNNRISPYFFFYEYPKSSGADQFSYDKYPAKYRSGNDDVTGLYKALSPEAQNPSYNPFISDAWGNYQVGGDARFAALRPWLDQKKKANEDFDPAAWHLKRIKLPSGGEIHVQYEQDDYAFVQDQAAHVMAPLKGGNANGNVFILDTDAIGITQQADRDKLRDMIRERYVNNNEIYFKFLYRLVGDGVPDLQMCNADFITGYASVTSCQLETDGSVSVTLKADSKRPSEICEQFVKAERLGMIDPDGNCTPGFNSANPDGADDGSKATATVNALKGMMTGTIAPNKICKDFSISNSYLRVPTPLAKKGGGVRVKRLLTFDAGIEDDPVLFGNEYLYQTKTSDGRVISSGVATNEPQTIREENILVDYIGRKGQGFYSRTIAGKDVKQSEGPLGESILPGASVGYSKVIVRNIHSGKTNPGFSVTEFYTAQEFPVVLAAPDKPGTMTGIDAPAPIRHLFPGILVNIVTDKSWAAQGFSFVLNDMHGKMKRTASYRGAYDLSNAVPDNEISSAAYEYFKRQEKVPVASSLYGQLTMKNPGREVDITFSQKRVEEATFDGNLEGDVEIAIIPAAFIPIILFYPTGAPTITHTEGSLFTHATSKVIRYPAILKKTTVSQEGIIHTEENVAFDEWTGQPVAVKSGDEFAGAYLSQNIPASWQYPNFTAKYVTEGKRINKKTDAGQSLDFSFSLGANDESWLSFTGDIGCQQLAQLTTGDVLDLDGIQFQVTALDYSQDRVKLVHMIASDPNPGGIETIEIVCSGRTNKLSESAGSVTFHDASSDMMTPNNLYEPDATRFVTSGTSANDGTQFVSDLNTAYTNFINGGQPSPLPGPYYHMNVTQYVDRVPAGCPADLADAEIQQVTLQFKDAGGNVSFVFGTFMLRCGSDLQLIKTED